MKKRIIGLLLAVSTCASVFAGCGSEVKSDEKSSQVTSGSASEVGKESSSKDQVENSEPVNIVWARYGLYQTGDYETAQQEVEDALNEYLADNYGITVDMICYTMADYQEKMPLELAADADIDVMSCGTGIGGVFPDAAVQQGLALDITDLLQKEASKLFESISENIWKTTLYGGKYYFVPTTRNTTSAWAYTIPNKLIDKYDLDVSAIKEYEDWEPILEVIKDDPDVGFAFCPATYAQMMKDEFAGITEFAGIIIGGDETKVVFTPDTEGFMEHCKLMKKWADAGYWPADMAVNLDSYKQMRNAGNYGAYLKTASPVPLYAYEKDTECTQVIMTEKWMGSALNAGYIINAKTEQPEASIKFLEALMTDPVVGDLATYGIEDKHYTRDESGAVTLIDDSGYRVDSWSVTDPFNISVLSSEPANIHELTKEFIADGVISPITGFVFDSSSVSAEMAACAEVTIAYRDLFIYGMVDPEVEVPKYSKALKDAGAEKIVAEIQRQFDEFLQKK